MDILEKSLFYSYLSCSKAHAFRFLEKEIDVTPLFWCSYEPIYSVFESIIQDNKTPWEYNWAIKPFDEKMGIYKEVVFSGNFRSIKQKIIDLLENGYIVQVGTKNKHIPHMVELESDLERTHSLAITSYDSKNDSFIIYDYPFEKKYNAEIIEKAYDQVSSNYLTYYRIEKDDTTIESSTIYYQLFQSRMLEIKDDFNIYEELKIPLHQGNICEEKFIYFFGTVALSRELTFIYLSSSNLSEYVANRAKRISKLAETIKQLLIRCSMKKDITEGDSIKIIQKIDEIKKMELEFLNALKDELISGKKRELIKCFPNPPVDICIDHITDSSAWLSWSNKEDERYEEYTYNIHLNSNWIASANTNFFLINNLEPDTRYVVSINCVDSSGQISKEGKGECFKTCAEKKYGSLSDYKFVSSSSFEDENRVPHHVVDNDESTRWSSTYNDDEWICIDLGRVMEISKVRLHWESAHAIEYKIQTSIDLENWNDIHHEKDCRGGIEEIENLRFFTRYVRVLGIKRATIYGYSLWEFSIYNGT